MGDGLGVKTGSQDPVKILQQGCCFCAISKMYVLNVFVFLGGKCSQICTGLFTCIVIQSAGRY